MSGDIVQLCQTVTPECYIGSVAWIKEGNYIALGDSDGVVQVGVFIIIISLYLNHGSSLPQSGKNQGKTIPDHLEKQQFFNVREYL